LQAQSVLSQGLEIEVAPVPLIFPENVETEAAPKQVPFIETQGKLQEKNRNTEQANIFVLDRGYCDHLNTRQ
jgi:hypothetical protein